MRRAKPVDQIVGQNIRLHRNALKMNQTDLGTALGITFQQIQKYEKGSNRVSASALHAIAGALGVKIVDLFSGVDEPTQANALGLSQLSAKAFRLAVAFDSISNTNARQAVVDMVALLAPNDVTQPDNGAAS